MKNIIIILTNLIENGNFQKLMVEKKINDESSKSSESSDDIKNNDSLNKENNNFFDVISDENDLSYNMQQLINNFKFIISLNLLILNFI